MAPQALRGHKESAALLAPRDRKEYRDPRVWLEGTVQLACPALRGHKESAALLAPRDRKESAALLAPQDRKESAAQRGPLEVSGHLTLSGWTQRVLSSDMT